MGQGGRGHYRCKGDIYDGTIILSPYQADLITDVQQNQTAIRTPGGVISLKREGNQIEVGVVSTNIHFYRNRVKDSPSSSVNGGGSVSNAGQYELANALKALAGDNVELDFSQC